MPCVRASKQAVLKSDYNMNLGIWATLPYCDMISVSRSSASLVPASTSVACAHEPTHSCKPDCNDADMGALDKASPFLTPTYAQTQTESSQIHTVPAAHTHLHTQMVHTQMVRYRRHTHTYTRKWCSLALARAYSPLCARVHAHDVFAVNTCAS